MRSNATSQSGTTLSPSMQITASTSVTPRASAVISRASACTGLTFPHSAFPTLAWARASMPAEKSEATTWPEGPIRSCSSGKLAPVPQGTSRTDWPGSSRSRPIASRRCRPWSSSVQYSYPHEITS